MLQAPASSSQCAVHDAVPGSWVLLIFPKIIFLEIDVWNQTADGRRSGKSHGESHPIRVGLIRPGRP
jgi:hypothetical protein